MFFRREFFRAFLILQKCFFAPPLRSLLGITFVPCSVGLNGFIKRSATVPENVEIDFPGNREEGVS
jgi:hypothetical protein